MTPLRQPVPVHGHVTGLLCRGMPMRWPKWVVASGDPRDTYVVIDPSDPAHRPSTVDWASPLAIYAALHWLTDRGHRCLWMLPATHGGKVEPWDGLTAWEVSAILVSASVLRVAEGGGPVKHLLADYRDETLYGAGPEIHRTRWVVGGVRRIGPPRVISVGPHGWHYDRAVLVPGAASQINDFVSGPETGAAGMTAGDGAALADGAALLMEGGVVVRAPGAP